MGRAFMVAALGLLVGSTACLANGMADMVSDGRVVVWDAHRATFLTPGQPGIPLGKICTVSPATIIAGSDGLNLYNGRLILQAWFLDSAGHRWYWDEATACADKGPVF